MTMSWYLPLIAFALLVVLERDALRAAGPSAYTRADHLLNLSGLAIQGALVPLAGYWVATRVLTVHWPQAAGTLEVGWLGAFLLNFVALALGLLVGAPQLVNPVLGFLCDRPDAFFAAAAVTASLDLWRHSRLSEAFAPPCLGRILVTPAQHHAHHSPSGEAINFGANLILWDKLFGTARIARGFPAQYGTREARGPWRQFLFPW